MHLGCVSCKTNLKDHPSALSLIITRMSREPEDLRGKPGFSGTSEARAELNWDETVRVKRQRGDETDSEGTRQRRARQTARGETDSEGRDSEGQPCAAGPPLSFVFSGTRTGHAGTQGSRALPLLCGNPQG